MQEVLVLYIERMSNSTYAIRLYDRINGHVFCIHITPYGESPKITKEQVAKKVAAEFATRYGCSNITWKPENGVIVGLAKRKCAVDKTKKNW